MNTYRNTNFTKRDYESTNIVACQTEGNPSVNGDRQRIEWMPATEGVLNGLTALYICDGVRYFGYL
jgi:hypothetical protein